MRTNPHPRVLGGVREPGSARRRHPFLIGPLVMLMTVALALVAPTATAKPPVAYDQTYRPQFHFSPKQNWMNDPNGLLYYRGRWHMFFQHNPSGDRWGNMSWGHAVSTDLVHWTELPLAIRNTAEEFIFSGSAVVDTHNTSGFGTKSKPPIVAVYTSDYQKTATQAHREAQSLAYSTDGGLTFTKYARNPVLDIGSENFRDPKVFWYGPAHEWRMVAVKATEHKVAIYRSPNLKDWTHLSDFGPAGAAGGVWECPDLFPLAVDGDPGNVKWVMVVNLNPGGVAGGSAGQYFVGRFDGARFTPNSPVPAGAEQANWLDYGRDFYAGVTFNGVPNGRRVMIAWMNNWDYAGAIPTSPWRSAMSVPRELTLQTAGGGVRLRSVPVHELKTLRRPHPFRVGATRLLPGTTTLQAPGASGDTLELRATFRARDAKRFGLRVRVGHGQHTTIGYDVARHGVYLDRRKSGDVSFHAKFASREFAPLPAKNGLVRLRILVDRSSVEVFGGDGRVALTDQIFPGRDSRGLSVFSSGGRAELQGLTVWRLRSSW